jgi:hypothetical protein
VNLAIGQVWIDADGNQAVVLEVRDEQHPRGLGVGYGDSAIAAPIEDKTCVDPMRVHPFDTIILCGALEHHGTQRWSFVESVHYLPSADGIFYAYPGTHPVRGDQ